GRGYAEVGGLACCLGGLAGLAEVGERAGLDRGLGHASVGTTFAELLAAVRMGVPTLRRILPGGAELGRPGRLLLGERGLVLVLEPLDGRERDDLRRVKAAAFADLLPDAIGSVVEDRRGRGRGLVGVAPGVGLLPHMGDLVRLGGPPPVVLE